MSGLWRWQAGKAEVLGRYRAFLSMWPHPCAQRTVPVISDAALTRLGMPVLAILGGADAMVDTAGTRKRLEAFVPRAQIVWLPEQGHFLRGQAERIDGFPRRAHALA
jgi:pimeloyl-ACP methyl ester carboxylesterase